MRPDPHEPDLATAVPAPLTRWMQWQRRVVGERNRPFLIGFLVVSALCLVCIILVDRPLALRLAEARDTDLFGFFNTITDLGKGHVWYALSLGGLVICTLAARYTMLLEAEARLRAHARRFLYGLTCLVLAGIPVPLIKVITGRFRPEYLVESGLYGFSPLYFDLGSVTFPSGHTQTAFTVMTVLLVLFPRYDVLYVTLAVLVGASRVFVNAHFLSDVLMGAFIGVAVPLLVKRWFERDGRRPARYRRAPWHGSAVTPRPTPRLPCRRRRPCRGLARDRR